MLAAIRGKVLQKEGFSAVVDVNGFGLEVILSRSAFNICDLNKEVFLQTSLQISDAGAALFGFGNDSERRMFRLLLLVKGIGGKLAMTLLQSLSPQEIISAVSSNDTKILSQVPGIGRKTSERICFELADKISKQNFGKISADLAEKATESAGVVDALESLGFDRMLALQTFHKLCASADTPISEEEAILKCLRMLQKK